MNAGEFVVALLLGGLNEPGRAWHMWNRYSVAANVFYWSLPKAWRDANSAAMEAMSLEGFAS